MEADMTQGRWDAVIIGAGLMGLFTAYHLRQRGMKRIAVLDRGHAGGVASPRAGGLLRCHYNHPLLVEMAMRGHKEYAAFGERYGGDAGFVQNGYVVCVGDHQAAALEKNVRMQQELGVDVLFVTPEQFKSEFTEFAGLGTATVAAYERSCAYANPPAVSMAMVQACRKAGITVLEGYPVVGVETTNGGVSAVQTPAGTFKTDLVVNCAGAWAAKVGRMASVDVPVVVQRKLQIIEVERPAQVSGHLRTLSHETMDFYARPSAATRVWIGSRVPIAPTTNPGSIDLLVNEEKALRQREAYRQLATFPLGEITSSWAGIDGDTPDFQPILGPTPGVSGLYLAVGFSGHGFKLAPMVGQLMAEHITTGRFLTMDVNSLGFERFAQGRLFEPGYKQMGA